MIFLFIGAIIIGAAWGLHDRAKKQDVLSCRDYREDK